MTVKGWATIDSSKFPSNDNSKAILSAPIELIDKIIDLAVNHACQIDGEQDSETLKKQIKSLVDYHP